MALNSIVHIFGGSPLDRAADKREDDRWLGEQLASPSAEVVLFSNGRPLVTSEGGEVRLARVGADVAAALAGPADRFLFLGVAGSAPVFAAELGGDPPDGLEGVGRFEELRPAALALPGPEAGIAAAAKSLFDWRRRHRFCSACGSPSEDSCCGWRRTCPACGAEHFPRVDPVVIMLAVSGGRCLLGRNRGWPAGRMSALAGFVEPGESIEEACARELKEEAGLEATRVVYHSSQPWPFPSSLMIGLVAEVESDRATPDEVELEEVRWLTRAEARAALEGRHPDVLPLSRLGIARALLEAWADGLEV